MGESGCALRFEVFEGRGVLRAARPGVLADPPARVSGYEADLSMAQVRASRFLHVSNYGRRRQTWFLSRIADEVADRVEADAWHELTPISDRGALHLLLLSPEEIAALPRELAPPASLPPMRIGPLVPIPDLAREEAEILTLPPSLLQPIDDAPAAPPSPPPATAVERPAAAPEPSAGMGPTGLVRHLRRQLATERLARQELAARVVSLERRLRALDPLATSNPQDADGEHAATGGPDSAGA